MKFTGGTTHCTIIMMLESTSYKILIDTLKAISWQSLVIFNQYILSCKLNVMI